MSHFVLSTIAFAAGMTFVPWSVGFWFRKGTLAAERLATKDQEAK